MARQDVIVDDDFFTKAGQVLKDQAAFTNRVFNKYVAELEGVLETGLMEGETSRALREFVDCLKEYNVDNQIETEGIDLHLSATLLLKEVDDQDGYLYEE